MPINFKCPCGKSLAAPDGSEGKKARCPACGQIVPIPTASGIIPTIPPLPDKNEYELTAPPPPPPRPAVRIAPPIDRLNKTLEEKFPAPRLDPVFTGPRPLRSFMYCLLLLALIPLILSTFQPHQSIQDRFQQTYQNHQNDPAAVESMNKVRDPDGQIAAESLEQLFNALPDNKFDGAMLPRYTHLHWLIALAAAAAFLSFILFAFPNALNYTKGLLFAGIFTGTAGVLLLLGFQFAAFHMPLIIPRGIVGLVLLIVKLIGLSYALAESNYGFIPSFLGFTAGVGLCEEITKAIPLLFRIKPIPGEEDPTWYSLLLWGLASGTGFGIAEGIMYSSRYYNGLEGPTIYVIRFLSCVALHAMWAGANGVALFRNQALLNNSSNNWEYFFRVIYIVLIPMTLHGLYDTLLKQEYDALALLVALASFAWLAFQIERAYRSERAAAQPAPTF